MPAISTEIVSECLNAYLHSNSPTRSVHGNGKRAKANVPMSPRVGSRTCPHQVGRGGKSHPGGAAHKPHCLASQSSNLPSGSWSPELPGTAAQAGSVPEDCRGWWKSPSPAQRSCRDSNFMNDYFSQFDSWQGRRRSPLRATRKRFHFPLLGLLPCKNTDQILNIPFRCTYGLQKAPTQPNPWIQYNIIKNTF